MEESIEKMLEGFEGRRNDLIPMLQALQQKVGYLSEEGMKVIASYIGIPESKVYGTATFYSQFYFTPRGEEEVKVCLGTACHVRGALQIIDFIERELGIECGETTCDHKFSLERVNCVGACALAPVVMIGDKVYGRMDAKKVKEVLEKSAEEV